MTVGIEKSSEVSVNGDKVSLEVVLEHSLAAAGGGGLVPMLPVRAAGRTP